MKKALSLLSVMALFIVLFSIFVSPIGAEDGEINKSEFFASYKKTVNTTDRTIPWVQESDNWDPNANNGQGGYNGNVDAFHNAEIGAMELRTAAGVTGTTQKNFGVMCFRPGTSTPAVSTKDYPIFAVKVRLARTGLTAPTYALVPNSVGSMRAANYGKTYDPDDTKNWQLMIFDYSAVAQANATDNWGSFLFVVSYNTTDPALYDGTPETLAYVEWSGAFATEADAQKYFEQTTESSGDIKEETTANKAALYYDFSKSINTTDKAKPYMDVEKASVAGVTVPTTAIEYDVAMKAMKVSTADGYGQNVNMAKIHFFDPSKSVATSDYPIFALKVKMAITTGGVGTSIMRKKAGGWAVPAITHNATTTDWQLVYFDASAFTDVAPNWDLNVINLINNNTTDATLYDGVADTVAHIRWAGAFASLEDAQAWFDYTTPAEDPLDLPVTCTTAGIRKELDENGNQGLRFYQTLNTKLVDGKETVQYKGETLEVLSVYALMATERTLTKAGLTTADLKSDLVGKVTKVAKVKITNCRSRVVNGDDVTYTYTLLLTDVAEKNKRTDVCAVSYLLCRDKAGKLVEVYGNVQTTNVKKMYDAIGSSKFTGDIKTWMTGRADGLFLDFVSEQTLEQVVVNEKSTTISYSPENSAVLLSPLADGVAEANTIHLYPTVDVSVKDYPVFAMRIKLKNPNVKYGSFYWRTEASNEIYTKVTQSGGSMVWMQRVPGTEMTYEATDDWQIVYTSMRDVHNPLFTGNWKDVMNVMLPMGGTDVTTEDGIYIDWMGAFATVGDAFAHAGLEWDEEEDDDPYADLSAAEKAAKDNAWQINNQLSSEMTKLKVDTVLVDDYDPEKDVYAFRHHPSLAYFGGKWYAGFSNGVSDEDAPGQKMVYSVSSDFENWSEPTDLVLAGVASMGTENKSKGNADLTAKGIVATQVIGSFSVIGDRLYFYYTVQEYDRSCFDANGTFKGMRGAVTDPDAYRQYGIYTTDGITWSAPKAVSSINRYSTLQKSPHSDKWFSICGFRIHYSDTNEINPNAILSSGVMTNDQILSSRERCPGTLSETSYYQGPDGVLHLMCRSETGYIWAASSMDEGKTWSELYPTNFTSASTMFTHIMLPDGRIAWVGSPYYDTRWPLTLYVSEDGYNFDKAYILQDEIYDMQEQPAGWAKGGAFAYPQLVIEGDYLYILYTKQKEVVEICRVLLEDIQ